MVATGIGRKKYSEIPCSLWKVTSPYIKTVAVGMERKLKEPTDLRRAVKEKSCQFEISMLGTEWLTASLAETTQRRKRS